MKIRRFVFLLSLGILIATGLTALMSQAVHAQTCYDPTGAPIPCPNTGTERKKRKTPTPLPPTRTPIPTSTATAVPTATTDAGIPTTGGVGNPSGQVPAVQNPNPAPLSGLPGGFGGFLALLLLLGSVLIGLLLPAVRSWLLPAIKPGSPGDGSDKMGAQPHMNDGSDQGIIIVNSNNAAPQPHMDNSIGNPDFNVGTPSESVPGPPDMPGSNQAIDFRMKGSPDAANQFQKADDQFMKFENNLGPDQGGGEQFMKITPDQDSANQFQKGDQLPEPHMNDGANQFQKGNQLPEPHMNDGGSQFMKE